MRAMLPERLHTWVAEAVHAETAGQPAYVGHDLRSLSLRARARRTRAHRLQQEATAAAGKLATADKRRWRRDQIEIASLRRTHQEIAARLERSQATLRDIERDLCAVTDMHQTWQQWEQATRDLRSRGRLAAKELSLRAIEPVLSPPAGADPLAPDMSSIQLVEQYAIQSAAADWFRTQLGQRWAPAYLAQRGLTQPATEALAGYAPSRPGQWTLLVDDLRSRGYDDTTIHTAGLATRSRRGELIDRFRDRIMFPILDVRDRPIGFIGRKPPGDTNPDNPKYLNPPRTPLYDKSHVLLGLDSHAVRRLHDGARPIIVEGVMDRLAIRAAADDLVPLAPSGVALTAAHLDLLAEHTRLDRVILAFDPDPAGQAATLKAGRMLIDRGVPPSTIEIFTGPPDLDPADLLATQGAAALADALHTRRHRETLLDLLVDQLIDHYDTDSRPVRELPISEHAAYQAAKLVADIFRHQTTDPAAVTAHIQRHISRIIARTDIDARQLNQYLLDMLIRHDDLQFELPDLREHESELPWHSVEHEHEVAAAPDHDPGIA